MKVKLLSSLAGSGRDHVGHAGEEWECDEAEASRLIERGMAEEIIETTATAPPENAMRPKARPRKTNRGSDENQPSGDSEPQEASE